MIDETILKFLHDNCLDLVGIHLGLQSMRVTVTLKKVGGCLVVGRVDKGINGAEEDLLLALDDALSKVSLLDVLEMQKAKREAAKKEA